MIAGVTWAHYYGRLGLGRVQGSAMMLNITASALGPMPLAWLQAWFGSFGPGIAIMAILPVAAMVMMSLARPQRTALGSPAQ